MSEEAILKYMINYHGVNLTVVEYEETDYIPLKPIVGMLGTQWKTARENAFFGDNPKLLGTCELNEPEINVVSTLKGTKKSVYILLEAAEMYLARVNASRLRANGNEDGADLLLSMQKEWRKVLHDYETKGVAIKSSRPSAVDVIAKLDRIKGPTFKRVAAESANKEYGLNLPLGKQCALEV